MHALLLAVVNAMLPWMKVYYAAAAAAAVVVVVGWREQGEGAAVLRRFDHLLYEKYSMSE